MPTNTIDLTDAELDAAIQRAEQSSQSLSDADLDSAIQQAEASTRGQRRNILTRRLDLERESQAVEEERQRDTLGKFGLRTLLGLGAGVRSGGQALASAAEVELQGTGQGNFASRFAGRIAAGLGRSAGEYREAAEDLGGGAGSTIAGGLSESVTASAPALLAAPAGLPAMAAVAGVQSFGGFREQAADTLKEKDPTLTREEALAKVPEWAPLAAGAITAALTALMPGGTERLAGEMLKRIGGKEAAKQLVKTTIIKEIGKEIPEEMADQIGQNVIELASVSPEKPIDQIVTEVLMAGAGAAVTAGAVGGAAKGLGKIYPGKAEPEVETPDQAPERVPYKGPVSVGDTVEFLHPSNHETMFGEVEDMFQIEGEQMVSVTDQSGNSQLMPARAVFKTERMTVEPETEEAAVVEPSPVPGPTPEPDPGPRPTIEGVTYAPSKEPRTSRVDQGNLMTIAQDFVARINGLGDQATEEGRRRAYRAGTLLGLASEGKASKKDWGELAALFNLRYHPEATTMPSEFRHLTEERTDAAKTRTEQQSKTDERVGDDALLSKEGKDRQRQAEQREARPPDSGGGRDEPGQTILLSNTQRARYKGGQLVYINGQEERGPMEVVEMGPKSQTVRELSTGRVFPVANAKISLGRPASAESPSVKRADIAARRKQADQERKAAKTKADKDAAMAKLKAIATEEEEAGLATGLHQPVVTRPATGPRNAPAREPGKTRADMVVDREGVSYEAPVDPRDHFLADMLASAMSRIRQLFPGSHLRRINYVKVSEGDPVVYTSPGTAGMETVNVDMDKLAYEVKDMTPEEVGKYLQSVMVEEMVHSAGAMAIQQEWVGLGMEEGTGMAFDQYYDYVHELMWQDMTPKQRSSTAKAYGIPESDHVRLAEEFARGVVQKSISGESTEETLGARIVAYLRQWADALAAMVQNIRSGAVRNRLVGHIVAIENIVRQQEAAQASSQAGVVTRSGRKVGARLISKGEVETTLLNEQDLTPQQIDEIRFSGYSQNQSAIGHARVAYETLPDPVKGQLGAMEERFHVMDDMRTKLRIPENDPRSAQQMVESRPRVQQAPLQADIRDSLHSFMEEAQEMRTKLTEKRDLLRAAIESPEKAKVKGLKQAVTKIKWTMVRTYVDGLIVAKRNAATAGHATGPFDTAIDRAKNMAKTGSESLRRVAAALFDDPNPNNLDASKIGISPGELAVIKPMAQALGERAIAGIVAEPLTALHTEVLELTEADKFLQESVIGSEEFQNNLKYIQKATGLEMALTTESDATMTIQDPYAEEGEDGKVKAFTVRFNTNTGVDAQNEQTLRDAAQRISQYVEDPAADPIRKAHYVRQLDNIYNVYLNSHFMARGPKSMVNELTVWSAIPSFLSQGYVSTAEHRLTGVGTMSGNLAMLHLRNLSQMEALARRIHAENSVGIFQSAHEAAEAHAMTELEWSKRVANMVLASYRESGAIRIKAGDKVGGRVVTAKDVQAIGKQVKFMHELIGSIQRSETTQNKAFPLKIQDLDRTIPIFRYAGHTGPFTMPEKINPVTASYVRMFRNATNPRLNPDPAKRLAEAKRIVSGNNSDGFLDLVMGHMWSVWRVPSYAKAINSPFRMLYRDMAHAYDEGSDDAPQNFDDVVNYLTDNQPAPEPGGSLMTKGEVEVKLLFHEIGRVLKNIDSEATKEKAQGSVASDIDFVRADNYLTNPRKGAVLPATLYDYTVTTNGAQVQNLHAVYEVFAQRYYEALKRVKKEVDDYIDNVTKVRIPTRQADLKAGGMKARKAERKGAAQVKAETKKELLSGEEAFDYGDAKKLQRIIATSMSFVDDFQSVKHDFFNEELSRVSRATRSLLANSVLGKLPIVLRNRMGGTLRGIHIARNLGLTYGWAAKAFSPFDRISWLRPFAYLGQRTVNDLARTTDQTARLGAGVIKWASGNGWLQKQLLASKPMQESLAKHHDFWEGWAGSVLNYLMRNAGNYDHIRRLGLTGSAPLKTMLSNWKTMFFLGGKIRTNTPSAGQAMLGALESMINAGDQLGLLNPGNIKHVKSVSADTAANVEGMSLGHRFLDKYKENALTFLGNRREMGLLARTTLLTPQELTGNRLATMNEAVYGRNLFAKAGINLDAKMLDYYNNVHAARARGEPADSVQFLTNPEWNSFQLVMADEANRSSLSTRPELFNQTELGRWMGMFLGYPIRQLTKYAEARARVSSEKRGAATFAKGNAQVALWLLGAMVLGGLFGEEAVRILEALAYNERRQTQSPFRQDTIGDAAGTIVENSGPMLPFIAAIYNSIVERSIKPGAGVGRSGVNVFPSSLFNDILTLARETYQTGSAEGPTTRFAAKYFPDWKIVLNRFPSNAGGVEYYNTTRSIRASAPDTLEVKRGMPGNVYDRTSTTDNKEHVVFALGGVNGPDWDTVFREREIGTGVMMDEGKTMEDARRAFDSAVLSKMPFRNVLEGGRLPTRAERDEVLRRMTQEDRDRLNRIEDAFKSYATRFGRSVQLFEDEIGKKAEEIKVVPIPSSGRFRRDNPFLDQRQRERVLPGRP